MALQMNVSGIRRNIKNIAHNYTDAQVKVREATSNDPWGPSSTLMAEISDLTYNVVAFTEIMQMIWKRLNDHGRNWRHVYKALVLLEYLIKTGSDKVSDQCRENIFAIQTLKDFQFLEENKDMGLNVREKAKSLVSLLRDEERLLNERVRAMKAKKRFAQTVSGIGSETENSPSSPSYGDTFVTSSSRTDRDAYGISDKDRSDPGSELENARPQTIGEEELQLQLALAMSKEEADQEEAKKKSDDVRLQMALNQSETDSSPLQGHPRMTLTSREQERSRKEASSLNDLLDINFNPNGAAKGFAGPTLTPPGSSASSTDPWGLPVAGATGPAPPTAHGLDVTVPGRSCSNDNIFCAEVSHLTANDPWGSPSSAPSSRMTSPPVADPWRPMASKTPDLPASEPSVDPWAPVAGATAAPPPMADPWAPIPKTEPSDPFAPISNSSSGKDDDEFAVLSSREKPHKSGSSDPLNLCGLDDSLPNHNDALRPKSKSPAAFLGENSNLVNLDNLVSAKSTAPPISSKSANDWNENTLVGSSPSFPATFKASYEQRASGLSTNPFASLESSSFVPGVNPFNTANTPPPNPFQAQQPPKPSLNQMRTFGGPNNAPGLERADSPSWTLRDRAQDPFVL